MPFPLTSVCPISNGKYLIKIPIQMISTLYARLFCNLHFFYIHFNYTPHYKVAKGIMLLTSLSVSQSISPVFCKSNPSETAAWSLVKLSRHIGHNLQMCILPGTSNSFIFVRILNLQVFQLLKTKEQMCMLAGSFCELCLFSNYFVHLMHTLHSFICTIVKLQESIGYVSLLNFSFIKRLNTMIFF